MCNSHTMEICGVWIIYVHLRIQTLFNAAESHYMDSSPFVDNQSVQSFHIWKNSKSKFSRW